MGRPATEPSTVATSNTPRCHAVQIALARAKKPIFAITIFLQYRPLSTPTPSILCFVQEARENESSGRVYLLQCHVSAQEFGRVEIKGRQKRPIYSIAQHRPYHIEAIIVRVQIKAMQVRKRQKHRSSPRERRTPKRSVQAIFQAKAPMACFGQAVQGIGRA